MFVSMHDYQSKRVRPRQRIRFGERGEGLKTEPTLVSVKLGRSYCENIRKN